MLHIPPPVSGRFRTRAGHTLFELTMVLVLLGAGAWSLAAGARRMADRAAVEGAREEVAGLLTRARREAILAGGAEVVLTTDPPRALLRGGGILRGSTPDLRAAYGVTFEFGGDGDPVRLRWDALGLGRMTSRTLAFTRGEARAELVLSSYGRIRRR